MDSAVHTAVLYPDIATPILEKKIENIKATGADVVAVDCPGCMMQIRGGLDAVDWISRLNIQQKLLLKREALYKI